jgi:cytochrome P450
MRPSEADRLPRFDPGDPELLDDPYPVYARLRAAGPICRGAPGQWVVSRHTEVAALLRDPTLRKNLPDAYYRASGADDELSGFLARMNLGRRDRRASAVLAQAFRPIEARGLTAGMTQLVDRLLEPGRQRGRLDLVSEVALPLPLLVICDVLGVPEPDRDEVWPRVAELVAGLSDATGLSTDLTAAAAAYRWLRRYLTDLIHARRRAPRADLLSRLANEATLPTADIVDNALMVFYAGFETSKGMIANGVVALLNHPDQVARLRADGSLLDRAVDEVLRYEAPIQLTFRAPTEPIVVAGIRIRVNRVLVLLLGSANRDGSVFPEPDRFDVGRRPNPHVSFGGGAYYCIGAALSKVEGRVALRRLLDNFVTIEPAGQAVRAPLLNFRSYSSVPLAVVAR